MATQAIPQTDDELLAHEIKLYYADPLGFVLFAFPWGKPGSSLEHETGPDKVQREFLESLGKEVLKRGFDGVTPVLPIRMAETSGHGTGKSAMGAWITWWILSTRPFSMGSVTAGTYDQLESKTWAAVKSWGKLCVTQHWFWIQETGVFHKQYADEWKVEPRTCKKENAQSFAGQHARRSTSWYLFDEASEVPDTIYETAEGGLTDGEPMWFVWGQPVRNTGEFYRICFGDKAERWNHRRVDGRVSKFTNKELIQQWLKDYGEDSDFCKVRIFGLPPSASELQYIDKARIEAACKRKGQSLHDDPLIAGFDVSGGGKAWNVIRFRRGLDGNPPDFRPWRLPGEKDPDRSARIAYCAELLSDRRPGRQIAALFIDSAYGAPIAERLKTMGFTNVYEITAGSESPDIHCLNMRAYMWQKGKDWLLLGGLRDDLELPEAHRLSTQLAIPGYHRNTSSKLVIESKESITKRGEHSPDDADAFLLTFARPVVAARPQSQPNPAAQRSGKGWGWA